MGEPPSGERLSEPRLPESTVGNGGAKLPKFSGTPEGWKLWSEQAKSYTTFKKL